MNSQAKFDSSLDYSDLVAELRSGEDGLEYAAADALEAQARRIAELEYINNSILSANKELGFAFTERDEAQARIAELEVPLCIGRRTIGIMAEEGMWQSENGRAVVAADELFRQDPYARIAELEAALKPFAHKAEFYLFDSDADDAVVEVDLIAGDLRAARAALGEKA